MKKLILVLDDLGAEAHQLLHDSSFDISFDIATLPKATALIVRSSVVTKELIDKAPQLKIISRAGVGMDNIDEEYALSMGIKTYNSQGGNAVYAAETTMGLILSLAHKIIYAHTLLFEHKKWKRGKETEGFELAGKTLGIVGCGNVGSRVATYAHSFAMKIVVYDPYLTIFPPFAEVSPSLESLLEKSDVTTLHTPLTQETYHMIDQRAFDFMPSHAYLVNACRGDVVQEKALVEALTQNKIAGAALDVFTQEPLSQDSPLFSCPNIITLPHLGGAGKECRQRVSQLAVLNILKNL